MKRLLPVAIGLLLSCASLAVAQEATPAASPTPKPAMSRAQSQRIIISTEKKLWEAWKTKNFKTFKTYLSADSITISDQGVTGKTEGIKMMESMSCEVKSYELSDIKVMFLDIDAALISYKATQDANCGGQALPPTVWASSAYVKRGGKWFAASHQETPGK